MPQAAGLLRPVTPLGPLLRQRLARRYALQGGLAPGAPLLIRPADALQLSGSSGSSTCRREGVGKGHEKCSLHPTYLSASQVLVAVRCAHLRAADPSCSWRSKKSCWRGLWSLDRSPSGPRAASSS